MIVYDWFSEFPLEAKFLIVLLVSLIVVWVVAVCQKIVYVFQDRKSQREYGKVVSFSGKRGKRRRWKERVQQLMDSAPSSGNREEVIRWKNEVLEMFENVHGSQSGYAKMLLERVSGLEKDADVSECVRKTLDYLGDIKESEF